MTKKIYLQILNDIHTNLYYYLNIVVFCFIVYFSERQTHMIRLRGLEEEIDAQVAKVEAQARDEAREKFEFEKKELMKKMEAETIELKTHLKLFQKVHIIIIFTVILTYLRVFLYFIFVSTKLQLYKGEHCVKSKES